MMMPWTVYLLGFMAVMLTPALVAQTTGASSGAPAQAPSPAVGASGEDSKLRQMEGIYQQQLRSRHIPVLGNYMTTLQKLAAQAADRVPYEEEIRRIQALISGGGVVDLAAAAEALKNPAASLNLTVPPTLSPATAQDLPPRPGKPRALVALTPALARRIAPLPAGSASPEAAAVGEIEWRIELLPAGEYDVVMQYSLPTPPPALEVRLNFAGKDVILPLLAAHATAKGAFRLVRLGRVKLETDARGEMLRLTAGTPDAAALRLRQVVLTRARDEE